MDCPFCETAGARTEMHRHLADAHADRVTIEVDEQTGRRTYEVRCPVCDAPWERQIKPRYRDPNFVAEYEEEIRLVAFDMLLYHIQGEHLLPQAAEQQGEDPA
ncbi:MAG TPA: hypothetical protein VGB52_15500 [Actinomycetota bacterium]